MTHPNPQGLQAEDIDPHEGLNAIYENGACWYRHSSMTISEPWIWKTPDDFEKLAADFESVERSDWFYLKAQSIAKQLRDAVEAYRKAQQ